MKRQSGFTLIELIIVIVILGILAVVAAPQFFNFGSDARASTVRGLEGSIKAASELVHARYLISGANENQVTVRPGVLVTVDAHGYATADGEGIIAALNIDSSDNGNDSDWVWRTTGGDTDGEVTDKIIYIEPRAKIEGNCFVSYSLTNSDKAPDVSSTITGC